MTEKDSLKEDEKVIIRVNSNEKIKKTVLSHASLASSTNSTGMGQGGRREIVETWIVKLFYLKWIFLAFALNILVLAFIITASTSGMLTGFFGSWMKYAAHVVLLIFLKICHDANSEALFYGTSTYTGYLFASQKGYSVVTALFMQSSFFEKFSFTSMLSYRSKCRKYLQRNLILWLVHHLSFIISLYISATITTENLRVDYGQLSCIIYQEVGVPVDRGFPTITVEMGVAEYIFGTSMGILTSENSTATYTTHIFPPQLLDSLVDGSTIVGDGFLTDISTSCSCSYSTSSSDLVSFGVDSGATSAMTTKLTELKGKMGMANHISFNETGQNVIVTTIMSGTAVCGGTNVTSPPVPVCITKFSNHRNGLILSTYMTDGTSASIAIKSVSTRLEGTPADMKWISKSLENTLGEGVSNLELPTTYPGSINPLVWWTTSNMQGINAAFLNAGLETFWAMVLRTGMQRTLTFKNTKCPQNVIDQNSILTKLTYYGAFAGYVYVVIQFLITFISLGLTFNYLISPVPIGPAIRFVQDPLYYRILLQQPLTSGFIKHVFYPQIETTHIWPKLDVVMRVGETIATKDDPERGSIVLDKPKLVTNMSFGKLYN